MEHINRPLKLHGIDGPIGVTFMILNYFQHPRPFAFPRFRVGMLAAKLRHTQSDANFILHCPRKPQQIVLS